MQLLQRVDGGARALVSLAGAFDSPLARAAQALTPEPRAEEVTIDRVAASLYVPGGGRQGPPLVFLNGATERGRHHPRVVRLAEALARTGHVVLVPDLPGVERGAMTVDAVDAAVACTLDALSRRQALPGGAALVGVSIGTPIALLAAERTALAGHVRVVAGLTGFSDLADLIRLATTGTYSEEGRIRPYPVQPFLSLCTARSVCAGLDAGHERERVAAVLDVPADDPDPLAGLRQLPLSAFGEEARATLALLANRDPDRFDELYDGLSAQTKGMIEQLSPLHGIDRLEAPVELLVDPQDKYFPLAHARALARASARVRVTTTGVIAHADARFSLGAVEDALALLGFAARALERARFG